MDAKGFQEIMMFSRKAQALMTHLDNKTAPAKKEREDLAF